MGGPAMFMPMPHGSPLFYPWHRVLLRQFELALQAAAKDPTIALPYWDWDLSGPSTPFTPDLLGGDGDAAQGGRVTAGPFAFAAGQFAVRVWDGDAGDPGLRREFGEDASAWLPTAGDIAAGKSKTPYWSGPSSFERVSEGVLHNPVHRWVGGRRTIRSSSCTTRFWICFGSSGRPSTPRPPPTCLRPAPRDMTSVQRWCSARQRSRRRGRDRGPFGKRSARPTSAIRTADGGLRGDSVGPAPGSSGGRVRRGIPTNCCSPSRVSSTARPRSDRHAPMASPSA
jgi:hypothetical protein